MDSIRCSSFQSGSSALDDLLGTISGNLVETLGEASEFVEIIPQLRDSIRAIVGFRRGNVPETVKGILDVVADLRLMQSFAIQPDIELVGETLPALSDLMRRMSESSTDGLVFGYGKFEYEFANSEFGRETSKLVTRTRIAVERGENPTLQRILGARAMSLLPSPSALWDLVPYSFVVDWFLDIGSRIRDLESVGLIALMNFKVFTHTYLITSPLTAMELGGYGLAPSQVPGSRPELRVFVRDVSSYIPPPRSGLYDFAMPTRLPNWLTAGSLAWQNLSKL